METLSVSFQFSFSFLCFGFMNEESKRLAKKDKTFLIWQLLRTLNQLNVRKLLEEGKVGGFKICEVLDHNSRLLISTRNRLCQISATFKHLHLFILICSKSFWLKRKNFCLLTFSSEDFGVNSTPKKLSKLVFLILC